MASKDRNSPLERDRHYAPLPVKLLEELQRVPPTTDGHLEYRPCRVRLKNGTVRDRVFIVAKLPYKQVWGIWPEDDSGKRHQPISEVATIEDSPSRLPPAIANEIYRAGETCMGGVLFALQFKDGSVEHFGSGNAVDFIEYPSGYTSADVAKVLFHDRGNQRRRWAPEYAWCIFDGIEGAAHASMSDSA